VRLPELAPELDRSRIECAVDPPLEVRSGHTLRTELNIRNRTGGEVQIVTNGGVTGYVVDPRTGIVVGGFSGAQRLPRVVFRLLPQSSERIPLVVGTASFVPDLGFAVPPGLWAVRVPLALGGGRGASTPPLPITVTP